MNEGKRDISRAFEAAKIIIDNRDTNKEHALIAITLGHTIAAVLLTLYDNPKVAAGMLNEGIVPSVEEYFLNYASKKGIT